MENALCSCKNAALKVTKPWMSSESASALQQIQSSDLTTADILEREVKNKKSLRTTTSTENETNVALFHERRDEGDGRSIADSSSSSYKGTQFRYDKMNSISRIKGLSQLRSKQN